MTCPEWVHDPRYTLATPWWHTEHVYNLSLRARLIKTAPGPFARRNLFCGNRLFQNKYEMSAWVQEAKGMTDPGDIWRYARQKEISIHRG